MQGKVSIVVTCYNKQGSIANTLRSICGQLWNNIEVILVNDGSTDDTLAIIKQWLPKFKQRGYETVLIDQKNGGVCAAARVGLQRITGDFVCCIDSDDEIEPDYCSVMAGWLQENPEYDYTVCGFKEFWPDSQQEQLISPHISAAWNGEKRLKYCLFSAQFCVVWAYMLRADYFFKCGIIENYSEPSKGSHEPGFLVPMHAYNGRIKCFSNKYLYVYYNQTENAHSVMDSVEKAYSHWGEYARLAKLAVSNLPQNIAPEQQKKLYNTYIDIFEKLIIYLVVCKFNYEPIATAEKELRQTIISSGLLCDNAIDVNEALPIETLIAKTQRRIICVGAKSKFANHLVPLIKQFICTPDEYWDENAVPGDTVCETPITKPDYANIMPADIFLLLPKRKEAVASIVQNIPTNNTIFAHADMVSTINVLRNIQMRW